MHLLNNISVLPGNLPKLTNKSSSSWISQPMTIFMNISTNDHLREYLNQWPSSWISQLMTLLKLTSYLFTSMVINSVLKITDLFPYCQFLAKYLNESYIFLTENKLISPVHSGFRPVDSVLSKYLLLPMAYINRSIKILKWGNLLR